MLDIKLYDGQVVPHFNIDEFKCKDNNEMVLNNKVIDHIQRLEKFRVWYNRVMIVTSGYRTPKYNRKVGGSPNSKHIEGVASDILLPDEFYSFNEYRQNEFLNNVKSKWIKLCDSDGLGGGVGFYDTFFHLDSRPKGNYTNGSHAFWDMRK